MKSKGTGVRSVLKATPVYTSTVYSDSKCNGGGKEEEQREKGSSTSTHKKSGEKRDRGKGRWQHTRTSQKFKKCMLPGGKKQVGELLADKTKKANNTGGPQEGTLKTKKTDRTGGKKWQVVQGNSARVLGGKRRSKNAKRKSGSRLRVQKKGN